MIDDLVESTKVVYEAYDAEILGRVRRSLFKRYNQVLQAFEGNDVDMKHRGIAKKQRKGTLAKCVAIDRDASKAALDRWIDGEAVSQPYNHNYTDLWDKRSMHSHEYQHTEFNQFFSHALHDKVLFDQNSIDTLTCMPLLGIMNSIFGPTTKYCSRIKPLTQDIRAYSKQSGMLLHSTLRYRIRQLPACRVSCNMY